jgi:hypothetical protein
LFFAEVLLVGATPTGGLARFFTHTEPAAMILSFAMKQKFHEDDAFIFRFFPAALHGHRADETNDTFFFHFSKS